MADVTFTPNHMPLPACYPGDVNALLDMLTTGGGLTGTIPDTAGGGVFVGSNPPSSSLTNKVWYKTDGAGRPLGVYMFYNGSWRRVYTGVYGEVRMFAGNPASYFDGSGRGIVGGDLDGWALCNGQNGTPNLADHFIIAAQSFGAGWVTSVEGSSKSSGGQNAYAINPQNLPYLAVTLPHKAVQSGTGAVGFGGTGDVTQDYPVAGLNGVPMGGGPLPVVPPYIALGYMMFVGYA